MSRIMVAALIVCSLGCHPRSDRRPGMPASEPPSGSAAGSGVTTQPANPDPCAWVTAAEASQILGTLDGKPWRGDHADHPEAAANGRACVYRLAGADSASAGGPAQVAVELIVEDVTATEGVASAMEKRLAGEVGAATAKQVGNVLGQETSATGGWDHAESFAGSFLGRLGGIGIKAVTGDGINAPAVSAERVEHLASLMRDRIPDRPIASPRASRSGGGGDGDPCALLKQDEVERALGKLAVPPFRSGNDELANPAGDGCSYYLGHHRVFIVDVSWDNGKNLFKMMSGFGQGIASVLATGNVSADTLEGGWDQAEAGPGGSLYFLKGDRMIEVTYRTAAADVSAAVRLAEIAVKRLAAR